MHIRKQYMQDSFGKLNTDEAGLERLQRALILNGFRMLQQGGILVYSTCSFTITQNEAIVAWLLDECEDASIESIPGLDSLPTAKQPNKYSRGYLEKHPGMINVARFSPVDSETSGLFIARIRKK